MGRAGLGAAPGCAAGAPTVGSGLCPEAVLPMGLTICSLEIQHVFGIWAIQTRGLPDTVFVMEVMS